MPKRSRDKGKAGERELAGLLQDRLGGTVRRALGQERDGGADLAVEGSPLSGWAVQVKRAESFSLGRAWRQAEADAGERQPVVAHRANGGSWAFYVRLTLDEFADHVRERGG